MSEKWLAGLGAFALGLVCACGGSDSSGPQQRSMVPAQPRQAAQQGDNRAPEVTQVRLEPSRPGPGDSVEARAVANDPDGDPVKLSYRWTVNGRPLALSGSTLPGGTAGRDDRIEVSVVASDGLADSQEARARASVEARAPSIVSVSFDAPEQTKPGDDVSALVDVAADDSSLPQLEYRWFVNEREMRDRKRTFSTAGLKRGDRIVVKVRARDGDALSETMSSKELVLGNSPPKIAGIPKAERDGEAFRYQFEAEDPDGDRSLRWRLTESPPGMTIDPIYGIATWRPTKEQAGTHAIEVEVSDNQGLGSRLRFEVTAKVTEKRPGEAGEAPAAPAAPARES